MTPAERLAAMAPEESDRLLSRATPAELAKLAAMWEFHARPSQLPPVGDWRTWLILAGRGWGKSRTAAEWCRTQAESMPGSRGAVVGRTAADARDVMVEGVSGLLNIGLVRPRYEPSKRRLTWANGSTATVFSADEPDLLRGPQYHWGWADELASFRYTEAFDQMCFGLRLGKNPRCVVSTTPRPTKIIRTLIADPRTYVTRGSSQENRANIDLSAILAKYDGTTLGRQELHAEILDETPGALWTRATLDSNRVTSAPPDLARIVVAIDPALTGGEDSDETGVIVAGLSHTGHIYILADLSGRGTVDAWARRAVDAYKVWRADRIVAEVNAGGDLVERVLRHIDPGVSYSAVHASRGKAVRAEPVAALYEQGRVHHVGVFSDLEDQMCCFVAGQTTHSPDRMDACVWACTELSDNSSVTDLSFGLGFDRGPQWRG